MWGRRPGVALGLALVAAGLRWGTLGLGDVQAATRTLGPTLAAGPPLAALGAGLAFAGALLEEARTDGLRAASIAERAVAGLALLALAAAYIVPGAGDPSLPASLGWWTAAGAALTLLVLALAPLARLAPRWTAVTFAAVGIACLGAAIR